MRIVLRIIKNKYFLTTIFVAVWVVFFDKNDVFSQFDLRKKLKDLETEKQYYITEIEKNKNDLHELRTNPQNLEKFAREKYLMKKDNEDIFVIVNPEKEKGKP
ncbi:MAG TPA: septum formation initiator family protein [Bacteroidia bacterium]|jgi:cell division protein FtsB